MKKKSYMLLSFAVLLGFTACSSDDWSGQPGSGKEVVVKATIGHNSLFTRTTPESDDALEQAKFTAGDQMRINDGTKDIDYVLGNNNNWEPATSGEVLTWDKGSMTFNAFFPSNVEGNTFTEGSVQNDQSTKENLVKSDYMTATKTVAEADDHTLNLTFERKTARVVVEIADYNDQFNATDNPITLVGLYGAVDTKGKKNGVKAYNVTTAGQDGGGTKFVALLFPTTADANTEFLALGVNDKDGSKKALRVTGTPQLEAGNSYTVKVTVGKNKAQVESVTVTPWTEGSPIPGGEATERQLDLSLDGMSASELSQWLETNVGDKTKYTVNVSGVWNEEFYTPFREFLAKYPNADLTLNLDAVTGMTEIKGDGGFYQDNPQEGSTGLGGIVLPGTITSIGKNAFAMSRLKSITLNEGLESIGEYAFYETPMEELTLPATLVNTTQQAFALMSQLKTVRFKGDVQTLGGGLFDQDGELTDIYLDNCTSVPTLSDYPFNWQQNVNQNQGTITVWVKDAAMKAAFEADENWKALSFLKFTYAGEQ